MLTIDMLNKAAAFQSSHEKTVEFMDEILSDIEVLKLILAKRRSFLNEEAIVYAIEAGRLIGNAREELTQ